MSSSFILMGLLVLAGFALGLLVGWLTWTSSRGEGEQPIRRVVPRRPMTRGLPDWEVEQGQNQVKWTAVDPTAPDPTVVIGPRPDDEPSPPDQS